MPKQAINNIKFISKNMA